MLTHMFRLIILDFFWAPLRNNPQENFSYWLLRYGKKFSGVLFFVNLQLCPYRDHCGIGVIKNNFTCSSWTLYTNMKLPCNLSTQDNVIIICITYWAVLFSYIIKDTYRVICNKCTTYSSSTKVHFVADPLDDWIFERVGLWILFVEATRHRF